MPCETIGLAGGGFINLCADGETLLLPDLARYVELLVKEGHYLEIVSNMLPTKKLQTVLNLGPDILSHVEFKCSLHYLELEKKGLLKRFSENVAAAWDAGASTNIEITPTDELIPKIDDVKQYCMENFGALAHLTIARDDRTNGIERLTNLSKEEYDYIWGQFDSSFFSFKETIFGVKQTGFCEAGSWMYQVDMSTGEARQCYTGCSVGNIFENPDSPLPDKPIGHCLIPHCYNGHMLMAAGLIPGLTDVRYGDIRDRERVDGTHWLRPELKDFFNGKLDESNVPHSTARKAWACLSSPIEYYASALARKVESRIGKN